MTLPEGRKPLTDQDMVILLHNIAREIGYSNKEMELELRQTADRFSELSKSNLDIDPEKRDWEYDGFGVKRDKESFSTVK